MRHSIEIKHSMAEDGHPLTTFKCGDRETTLNRSVRNPELVAQVLHSAGALTRYERNMLGQWLMELFD